MITEIVMLLVMMMMMMMMMMIMMIIFMIVILMAKVVVDFVKSVISTMLAGTLLCKTVLEKTFAIPKIPV